MTEEQDTRNLTTAVGQLAHNVHALDETLVKEYPKRKELERDYMTKYASRRRWTAAGVGTVAAIIFSYFSTVGTVNYCFLSGIPAEGSKPICKVFPNWDESFENNRRFAERFAELEKEIASNRGRLNKIESTR